MGSRDHMRMPESLVPPSLVVVVLGLVASLGWGVADFGGGLASRRAPVLAVLLGSQLASLLVIAPILWLLPEPAMRPLDVLIGISGGICATTGLAFLYRGLSVGRMGVVAPVAAVLTATLPVAFGFLTEGAVAPLAMVGIALAAASVVLVSRSPTTEDQRPSGLGYAIAAGTVFGLFIIAVSGLGEGLLLSPIVLIRTTGCAVVTAWIVLRRQPWRISRRLWPALFGIGLIDMAATAANLAAIAIGPLAIAAIMASLYPVVTAVLAAIFLRERVTLVHAAGIVAAGLGVVLIAGTRL
jgi:drug/metabolite transporter (DMT)-like permease